MAFRQAIPDIGGIWERCGVQLKDPDRSCRIVALKQRVTKNIQGGFAKIKGGTSVILLLEFRVVVERRLQTFLSILLAEFFVERHGPRPPMVTGMTPHIHALVAARLNLLQVLIYVAKHTQHFACAALVGIIVGCKIVGTERLAFLA